MAIHPNLGAYGASTIDIEAWTEQATAALNTASLSSPAVRGSSVTLAISLEERSTITQQQPVHAAVEDDAQEASRPRLEPLRRDSLNRREALLKGKEGSRRRQRWENGISPTYSIDAV